MKQFVHIYTVLNILKCFQCIYEVFNREPLSVYV